MIGFELLARDGAARRGRLVTAHGAVDTPVFMPVGTAGTVKAMTPEGVAATGARIVLGNTYHLMLRPGAERIAALGGLHRFMNWPHAILTDSGGFQVMSLAARRTIGEAGVTFRSHLDGSLHELTPERSVAIQHLLGADVTMALDECTPYPAPREAVESSMELSMRWAERSRRAFVERPGHGVFGIVQGGVHPDLRLRSAARLIEIGFDGYAVGGLGDRRGAGDDLRGARRDRAGTAGGPAALSDGCRQAGRSRRRGVARHRHVRLRACRRARAAPRRPSRGAAP